MLEGEIRELGGRLLEGGLTGWRGGGGVQGGFESVSMAVLIGALDALESA